MKLIFSRNSDIDKMAFSNWHINSDNILNLINMADGFMTSCSCQVLHQSPWIEGEVSSAFANQNHTVTNNSVKFEISLKEKMKNKSQGENKTVKPDLLIQSFTSTEEFAAWLAKHHIVSSGIWIRLFKIKSKAPTITYAQALDVALCYGWIDGQKKAFDTESWLQKFTPRRRKSIWSKRNREHVERLLKLGMIEPEGIKEVEAAKADGRWEQAYDSSSNMIVPTDFLNKLAKDKKAEAFFNTLNKTNIYSIVWRLQTAKKPETRNKRMNSILEMLKKGEKFNS